MSNAIGACLLGLVAWAAVEPWLLRRRAAWMARIAFLPLVRPVGVDAAHAGRVRDGEPFSERGVDVVPPTGSSPGWMRVRRSEKDTRGSAGVARVDLRTTGEQLSLRVRYYPAFVLWTLGMVAILAGVIVALARWEVSTVLVTVLFVMWAYPAWSTYGPVRERVAAALDRLAEPPKAKGPEARSGRKRPRRKR